MLSASQWYAARVTLLMTVTLVAACATSPPRSPEQVRADEVTAGRISTALNADPNYFYGHVDVRVRGGVAHLSGYVWGSDAIFRAKQIAATVPGVGRVVNEMEFEPQSDRNGGSSRSR